MVRREDGGPARLARGVDLPAKVSGSMTGSTWVPMLPKWGAGIRPGTVPSSRLGPGSPPQPAGSPTFWPRALLVLGPAPRLCLLGWPRAPCGPLSRPLIQATSLPTRPRRPSPGGGGVFSLARRPCQKHLVYKLAAASRLPPQLWALG